MIEATYDGSLEGLFIILDRVCGDLSGKFLPDRIRRELPRSCFTPPLQEQAELFEDPKGEGSPFLEPPLHLAETGKVPGDIGEELYEISIRAYDTFLHAWMSELPIEAGIIRFAWKIITAARRTGNSTIPQSRYLGEKILNDQGDPLMRGVFNAAHQVRHEIHRLMGFLRFTPNPEGLYCAYCAPDHFTLPGLAYHFTLRFGSIPWAIIDEKRRLMLIKSLGQEPQLRSAPPSLIAGHEGTEPPHDCWESLWRNYHRSINNTTRSNPELQRQFMPLRYWKYLSEMH